MSRWVTHKKRIRRGLDNGKDVERRADADDKETLFRFYCDRKTSIFHNAFLSLRSSIFYFPAAKVRHSNCLGTQYSPPRAATVWASSLLKSEFPPPEPPTPGGEEAYCARAVSAATCLPLLIGVASCLFLPCGVARFPTLVLFVPSVGVRLPRIGGGQRGESLAAHPVLAPNSSFLRPCAVLCRRPIVRCGA